MPTSTADLKEYFSSGAKPTEEEFGELIDAYYHKDEDDIGLEGITVEQDFIGMDRPLQITSALNLVDNSGASKGILEVDGNDLSLRAVEEDGLVRLGKNAAITIDEDSNVGIGVSSPNEKLHVSGNLRLNRFHTSGGNETAELIFTKSSTFAQFGALNTIARLQSLAVPSSPQGRILGRLNFSCHYKHEQVIVQDPTNPPTLPPSSQLVLSLESTSRTNNPGLVVAHGDLNVHRTARKPDGGNWTELSDLRLKEDIKEFREGLNVLKKLNPVSYRFNGKGGIAKNGKTCIGFIAQEVKEVRPEMVEGYMTKLNPEDKEEVELLTLNTSSLPCFLLNAILELDKRLGALETQLRTKKKPTAPKS